MNPVPFVRSLGYGHDKHLKKSDMASVFGCKRIDVRQVSVEILSLQLPNCVNSDRSYRSQLFTWKMNVTILILG